MDMPQKTRITIDLDPQFHAFVEHILATGVFPSRDRLFEEALLALVDMMEAQARINAIRSGVSIPDALTASLEEISDVLEESEDRKSH